MTRNGAATRERILDGAERLVLDKGLASTSVDDILDEAGTSKGAFFHHFPTKNHLARALVERYAAADRGFLDEFMTRAEAEHPDDPAGQLLAFVSSFVDVSDELVASQPSCLYVSYIYDKQLSEDGTNAVIEDVLLAWRARLAAKLREADAIHPLAGDVDLEALADHVVTTFEGAFLLARALGEPGVMRRQLELVRDLLALSLGVSRAA